MLTLFANVLAQDNESHARRGISYEDYIIDDTANRYSVGINLQSGLETLISPNTSSIDLILRKQVGKYNALRYGLSVVANAYNTIYEDSSAAVNTYAVGLSLGYEWQTLISHRWKLYYGADIGIGRELDSRKENSRVYRYLSDDDLFTDINYSITRAHLNLLPFVGFRYNITPRMFLSTELMLVGQYSRTKVTYDQIQRSSTSLFGASIQATEHQFFANFQPYSGIFFHYIF